MIRKLLTLISWLVAGVLLFFTARRWLFIMAALKPDPPGSTALPSPLPHVLLLAPIRNEVWTLPDLLLALERIDYAPERLTVVLIDDGSTDGSRMLLESWVASKANWHALSLEQNMGKANALNAALARFPQGEIIAIYDADERPRPEALRWLVLPFADERVGGVSGRRAVSNALASPAASYTTFEGLVHQLVTMRAKDRLNLAPAILGANCAYRRAALAEAGHFKPGALLEDSDLTVKLARAGWKVHFAPEAVSYHRVPESMAGYWRQHTRWARGFNEVAREQAPATLLDARLPFLLRLELLAFALGYLDRPALALGGVLMLVDAPARRLLAGVVAVNLLTPLLQIGAALKLGREPPAMYAQIVWLPFFFGLDIAMAVMGLVNTLRQSPLFWEERGARE